MTEGEVENQRQKDRYRWKSEKQMKTNKNIKAAKERLIRKETER